MPILNDDTVAKIQKRKYDAERLKKKKHAAKVAAQLETPTSFWEKNRRFVDTAAHAARQDYVFACLDDIQLAMSGGAPTGSSPAEWLTDVESGIAEDVLLHGICGMEIMALRFWREPKMLDEMVLNPSTKVFAMLGYVTAVPSHRYAAWQEYLALVKPPTPQQPSGYVVMKCTSPTCHNAVTGTEIVAKSIAARLFPSG
jgi:hypothetical protein